MALTAVSIDALSEELMALLEGEYPRRECLRIRLALEEVLSFWRERLGEGCACTCRYGGRLGRCAIYLTAPGSAADPFSAREEDDLGAAGAVVLARLGLSPVYRHDKGVNKVSLPLPAKEPNQFVPLGIAVALAVALGLGSGLLSAELRAFLSDSVVTPVLRTLLNALAGVSMPMVFLSICVGILDIGDMTALGQIGKKFFTSMIFLTFLMAALTVLAIGWMFPLSAGGGAGESGMLTELIALVLQVIPPNLVSPFLEGNALQIVFLGMCFGVAFLALGERVSLAAGVVRQLDGAVNLMMGALSKLIPVFVFLSLYTIISSSDAGKLVSLAQILLLTALGVMVMVAGFTALICVRYRLAPMVLIRKCLPPFLVSLTTASSSASFAMRLELCRKELGVAEALTNFGVPLTQTLFKPTCCAIFPISALCIAAGYGMSITPTWLLLCVFMSGVLTISAPPVPGGSKIVYTALFLQLGIPAEGLVLAMAAEAVLDFILTAGNNHIQVLLIVRNADKLGMLDQSILRKSTTKSK